MWTFLRKNHSLNRFIIWYFLATTLLVWIIGFPFLKDILSSETLFHTVVISYSSLPGKALVLFFAMSNYLCFLMFLTFIPALLLLLIAYLIPNKGFIWLLSVLTTTIGLISLVADIYIYQLYRFHLNSTLLAMIFNHHWLQAFDFSIYEILQFVVIVLFILGLQSLLAVLIWKQIILPKRLKFEKTIFISWFSGTLFCYLTLLLSIERQINLFCQQAPIIPLYKQFIVQTLPPSSTKDFLRFSESYYAQPVMTRGKLQYPLHKMQCEKPKTAYNIILIVVDALRYDSLKPQYMPEVFSFATKSWQFKQHISGGNGTQPGLFSLFYSLPASYWSAALAQEKTPVLIDLLQQYGYSFHINWSADMEAPPFNKTVFAHLPNLNYSGSPQKDVGAKDRHITNLAIQFLKTDQHKKPFFLNLFYDAPHAYCGKQDFSTPFQPADFYCSRLRVNNDTDPLPFRNRYLNSVHFVDSEIGKLLNLIEEKGYLDNSIIIITSDHGQEFNDYKHNYWGHASNFSDVQTHVPFIIHWPHENAAEINYLTEGYDLVPTIFERLFHCQNKTSDYSIGQNLLLEKGRFPFTLVGSYINMGLIEPDRITTMLVSGNILITDKKETILHNAKPRVDYLAQALELMRRYYRP